MTALDDAYRRHAVLRTLAAEESVRAFLDPSNQRYIEFEILEAGDLPTEAQTKLETFFEELGRHIDERGFMDLFIAFETLLEDLRTSISKGSGLRPPGTKKLGSYLSHLDEELAETYELLKFERDEIAHRVLPRRSLVASIDETKDILERVLSVVPPPGTKKAGT
jgi:hypothetical protein